MHSDSFPIPASHLKDIKVMVPKLEVTTELVRELGVNSTQWQLALGVSKIPTNPTMVMRRLAWVTYMAYIVPDPKAGWFRAAALSNPFEVNQ